MNWIETIRRAIESLYMANYEPETILLSTDAHVAIRDAMLKTPLLSTKDYDSDGPDLRVKFLFNLPVEKDDKHYRMGRAMALECSHGFCDRHSVDEIVAVFITSSRKYGAVVTSTQNVGAWISNDGTITIDGNTNSPVCEAQPEDERG